VKAPLALVIAATAFGVLLPKALPALLTSGQAEGPWAAFIRVLPAATIGALAAVVALGPNSAGRFRPEAAVAAAVAVAAALVVRRVRGGTRRKA
jgi:hypothetical protein